MLIIYYFNIEKIHLYLYSRETEPLQLAIKKEIYWILKLSFRTDRDVCFLDSIQRVLATKVFHNLSVMQVYG